MKGKAILLSILLAFVMVLVSCAKPVPPASSPEPIPVYQFSPAVKASLIEIPASNDLSTVGIWQNIGPIINGETAYVRNLVCAEENGKTILYAGTGDPGRILKWSEATSSWSDIGYEIPKLMEELKKGVNPFRWVGALAVDPTNPQTIYVGTGGPSWLAKSTDGGESWSLIDYRHSEPRSLAISNQNPQVVYLGTQDGLLKSVDGGETWKLLDNGIPTSNFLVWAVAMDPNDNSFVVAAGEPASKKGLDWEKWRFCKFSSQDGGQSWQGMFVGIKGANPGTAEGGAGTVVGAKFDQEDGLYLATEGDVIWYSPDRGKTWTLLEIEIENDIIGLGINLVISPTNPKVLYAVPSRIVKEEVVKTRFEEGGVFKSIDRGKTWQKISSDLNPTGGTLAISKDGTFLYATLIPSFRPAGVWRLKLK